MTRPLPVEGGMCTSFGHEVRMPLFDWTRTGHCPLSVATDTVYDGFRPIPTASVPAFKLPVSDLEILRSKNTATQSRVGATRLWVHDVRLFHFVFAVRNTQSDSYKQSLIAGVLVLCVCVYVSLSLSLSVLLSLWECVCVCVCLCLCISVCVCVWIHICMYVCVYVYMCTCVYIFMSTSISIYTHECIRIYAHTYIIYTVYVCTSVSLLLYSFLSLSPPYFDFTFSLIHHFIDLLAINLHHLLIYLILFSFSLKEQWNVDIYLYLYNLNIYIYIYMYV